MHAAMQSRAVQGFMLEGGHFWDSKHCGKQILCKSCPSGGSGGMPPSPHKFSNNSCPEIEVLAALVFKIAAL